jgi:hypothetical protein
MRPVVCRVTRVSVSGLDGFAPEVAFAERAHGVIVPRERETLSRGCIADVCHPTPL